MQRLKTRAQFQAVLAGATVARSAHFALHRTELSMPHADTGTADIAGGGHSKPTGPDSEGSPALFAVQGEPWIGVLLPKRWAKRAVTRNTIKRQVYSVSRELTPPLPAAAHVVRLRSGFDRTQFTSATSEALKRAVRAELQGLFAKAPR